MLRVPPLYGPLTKVGESRITVTTPTLTTHIIRAGYRFGVFLKGDRFGVLM